MRTITIRPLGFLFPPMYIFNFVSVDTRMWSYKGTCLLEARNRQLKKDTSCSGILIHRKHNFIITHSTFLVPFCTKEILTEINNNDYTEGSLFKGIEIRATIQRDGFRGKDNKTDMITNKTLNVTSTSNENVTLSSTLVSTGSELDHFNASPFMMWKAEKFAKTLRRLMPKSDGWKMVDDG